MTAWHDQPPVSRRHIRETERDGSVDPQSTPEQIESEESSFAGLARQGWEADARRASAPEGPPLTRAAAAIASGRRAQHPATNERPMAEPLAFVAQLPVQAAPVQAEPMLTRRQMRERGVGGFVAPVEADRVESPVDAAPPAAVAPVAAVFRDAAVSEAAVSEAVVSDTAVSDTTVSDTAAPAPAPAERLRFRDRVRRAPIESEEEAEAAFAPRPVGSFGEPVVSRDASPEPPPLIEPPAYPPFTGAIPSPVSLADFAVSPPTVPPVSFAEIIDAPSDQTRAVSADRPVELVSTPVDGVESTGDHEIVVAELEPNTVDSPAFEDLLFPNGGPAETTAEPLSTDSIPMTFDPFVVGHEAPAPAPSATETPQPEAPRPEPVATDIFRQDESYVPPVGHWSTQALIDDDEQIQENTFARDVGATSGAITTSALVLPSMPTGDNIMGPLSGTGEILITGSISLPSSVGSTGVHPARYDHSDVDALLEAGDREDSDPESAPVRAIRAISTNTVSGDVISSLKPQKASRLPLILIVSAAVMAVGVVVLLVAGFIFKIF